MKKEEMTEKLAELRELMERTCQRKMRTPKDFDTMSAQIFLVTHQNVNSSTLKRFYGYVGEVQFPRESTLDILCQYVGFCSWEAFVQQDSSTKKESNLVVGEHFYASQLRMGQRVRIIWQPDRVVVAVYGGNDRFVVIEAEQTKLPVGATFRCSLFIQNEPLYITEVTGLSSIPVDYVCGSDHGIRYSVIA